LIPNGWNSLTCIYSTIRNKRSKLWFTTNVIISLWAGNQLFILQRIFTIFSIVRCSIDLSEIEREITHQRSFALEDGAGSIMLLLSITGTTSSDTVVDLKQDFTNADVRQNIIRQYVSFFKNNYYFKKCLL
jgi:hypothetical protein